MKTQYQKHQLIITNNYHVQKNNYKIAKQISQAFAIITVCVKDLGLQSKKNMNIFFNVSLVNLIPHM